MGEPTKCLLADQFPRRPLSPPEHWSLFSIHLHPGSEQVAKGCIRHPSTLHTLDGSLAQS